MKLAIDIVKSRITTLERQRDNEELPQNVMAINFAINELERVLAQLKLHA